MRVSRVSRFKAEKSGLDQDREVGGIRICWIRSPRTRKKSRQGADDGGF